MSLKLPAGQQLQGSPAHELRVSAVIALQAQPRTGEPEAERQVLGTGADAGEQDDGGAAATAQELAQVSYKELQQRAKALGIKASG